jgi:integrase/recombinase XerD
VAELVFSTSSFCPFGLANPRVPILLDAQMRLIEPPCAWFLHLALVQGRTRSPATWRTYAEALYDWWQTCEANGWSWDRVRLRGSRLVPESDAGWYQRSDRTSIRPQHD